MVFSITISPISSPKHFQAKFFYHSFVHTVLSLYSSLWPLSEDFIILSAPWKLWSPELPALFKTWVCKRLTVVLQHFVFFLRVLGIFYLLIYFTVRKNFSDAFRVKFKVNTWCFFCLVKPILKPIWLCMVPKYSEKMEMGLFPHIFTSLHFTVLISIYCFIT